MQGERREEINGTQRKREVERIGRRRIGMEELVRKKKIRRMKYKGDRKEKVINIQEVKDW